MGKVSEEQMKELRFVSDILSIVAEADSCPAREASLLSEAYVRLEKVLDGIEIDLSL